MRRPRSVRSIRHPQGPVSERAQGRYRREVRAPRTHSLRARPAYRRNRRCRRPARVAFTAALALAAPLGALADPQRQPPAAPRSSFTNFDILKQLVKEHHAQTGKTVQARRNAGVVSRLGSFLDANAVRRRRLLGGIRAPAAAAQAASRAHNRPRAPRLRARPLAAPRSSTSSRGQQPTGTRALPSSLKRDRDSGWTPCSTRRT